MPEGPVALFRRLPAPVRLLVAGTFLNRAGTFIVPFLTTVLSRDFGLEEDRIAPLVAAWGAGTFVSVLTGGWLSDRLGRRATMLLSLAGGGSLAVAMGFARSFSLLAPL